MRVTADRARRARADIFCRCSGRARSAASIRRPACTTPQTSATYSFSTSRSWNCRASASCAAIVLGDDHHARGALVQPVHDARPQLAADAAEIRHVVEQRVDQRARRVAGGRVHDHPGRLVHDDDVGVLVEDGEREILGRDLARPPAPECRR